MLHVQLWWVHKGAEGSSQELWQSLRCWLWIAPNSIRAICKVRLALTGPAPGGPLAAVALHPKAGTQSHSS